MVDQTTGSIPFFPPLYTSKQTSLFGKVKPASSAVKKVDLLVDFYKICIYMKLELKHSNSKAILGFRTVGATVFFYLQYRPEKNMNLMIELGQVEVPTTTMSFSMLLGQLDTIYRICQLYHKHCTASGSSNLNSVAGEIPRSPTLPFSVVKALLAQSKTRSSSSLKRKLDCLS